MTVKLIFEYFLGVWTRMNSIDSLLQKIDQTQNPSVIGLDPLIQRIPNFIKQEALAKYGNTAKGAATALYLFNAAILKEIHPLIPAVKLQMACYEMYGSAGLDAFHQTVDLAKSYGLVVIDDSKRNDIGSTALLYAKGHLGSVPLIEGSLPVAQEDFVTINPWLGKDGIVPFLDECKLHSKGIFVLVKTSNPSSSDYQDQMIGDDHLYEKVAKDVHQYSLQCMGTRNYSSVGAVVGATWPSIAIRLRSLMPNCFLLVPGYGAQGGSAEQIAHFFNDDGYGAVISSSRGVIFAYQEDEYSKEYPKEEDFALTSRLAVENMQAELVNALEKANKLPKGWV
ncbi:MAG: orotidine-5'-phosphate decarboxylase [bacterium]